MMQESLQAFLRAHRWDEAVTRSFPADWSMRSYARLEKKSGSTCILMLMPPGREFVHFQRTAKVLQACGLKAPDIYAASDNDGYMLLEDYGENNCGRMVNEGQNAEKFLEHAIDVLIHINQNVCASSLVDYPEYGVNYFVEQLQEFGKHYVPHATGKEWDQGEKNDFLTMMRALLSSLLQQPKTLMLRDFMLDNLMWLDDRPAAFHLGILDFELAGVSVAEYDLVSLLEVSRRNYPDTLIKKAKEKFYNAVVLPSCFSVLSLQRHLRVLGVLARLSSNPLYAAKAASMGRIETHVRKILLAEECAPLRNFFKTSFPHWAEK